VADVRGKKNTADVSEARQTSMYVIKEVCGMTLKDIGKEFNGRDHSSVVYTMKKVEKKLKENSFYRDTVEDIIKNVKTL